VNTIIQMIDPARKVKMQSRVIGWETDECVIVEQPVHGSDSVQLKKETTVVVRGIHGGEIMGFRSSVIGQTINPFRMVFLSYPSKLEKHDFRKDRRINTDLEAFGTRRKHTLSSLNRSGRAPRGSIRDLSASGCEFSFHFRLETGMPIFISCDLPDGSKAENVLGFVRNARRNADGNSYGVEFDDRSGSLDGIARFVEMSLKILSRQLAGS
jgi:c-di-GMP-binding flagellar brake protein YcgR